MKFIIAVMCLCLAGLGHAEFEALPEPLDAQVLSVVDEMAQIGENTVKTLAHQYEEIVVEPNQQLEQAVDQLEARREESPQCVAAQDEQIASILDTAHEEMHVCGVEAAYESADIAGDVNKATQQLVFGGYSLGRTRQKCKQYKNPIMKSSCQTKLVIQGTVYMINARSSIKTIKHSTTVRVPAVFADSNTCTHEASEKAVAALEAVSADIDACATRANRASRVGRLQRLQH